MKQKLNRDPKRLQPLKRPVRLLRRVLSYNIDKAIRAAASGNTPFPTNTVEYAWDPVVPFGNSTFATPFSTMFQGDSEDPLDLNQSVYSMSSILTTISVIEVKIKNDPDGFVSQCQRVRKTLINCIPTEDQLAQLNGEHLRKIVMKIEHGLNKLDQYQKVIEDYFENNDNNLSDAQTRSLDLLMTSMQSTSLGMMAVQGKIKKIQESVELDERKSANPAFSFPSLLSGSDGTTVLQSHLTPSLPKSSVQFLPSRLFVSSNSSTVVSSLASSLTSSVPIASTFVTPSNMVGNVQFSTGSPITHLVNSNVMSSNIPSTGYQIPHQVLGPPLDSSSVILEAKSWKSFQFQYQNVLERLVLDDMYALAELLEQELTSNLTDGELKGIDSRKAKDVSKLQKSLIEKIVKIEATADSRTKPLIENCLAANDEANNWIRSLSKMMESREMWYESSKSLGCPLKLEPFDGYNSKMNVFEFIKVFKIITRNISPKDAADYLYQNYLSVDLQSMCKHVRHSFSDLSSLLVRRFGDPTRLLDDRKKQVKALPFPQRQNREQLMKYFKSLSEILDQLESLVNEHSMEFPQLQSEIYSHSCHSEIVRLLPEFIKKDYMEQYVTKCETLYDGDDLTGKESYSLLSKFIHRQFRQSQLLTEKYSEEKDKDKSSSKKPGVNFRSSPSSSYPAVRTAKQIGEDKWCQSVCFMHNTLNRRIRDCPMGKCDKFLNASPKERAAKAAEFGLCSCCFLFKCFKKSRGKFCSYKSEVPALVVCQPCAVKGIDINVLLCSLHKSDVASVRKALTTFLPEYEENTSIKMFTFRIFNANLETPIPSIAVKQPSGEEKVFDVCQGTVVEKQDVLNKIVPETIEDSIYLLQQLSFNGRAVTVLFDTGASASAVQGDFACETGFKIVDSTPRVICVAGGGEVSTGYGIFSCILGPSEQGQYVPISLLGMRRITSEIPQYNLSAMEKEVKIASQGSTIAKEQFPKYVGGDEIKMIIGIKDSYLMPKLLMTLPSGLMVFRSSIKDVYGSNLMFGGPHHSVTQLHKSLASGINNFRVMFANEYESYRNALDLPCYFLPKSCGIDADNYDSVVPFSSIHATVEEDEPVPVKNCGLVGGPACSCKGEILDLDYDFCRCCYFPGDSKVNDQLDSDLVSDDICILNANQLDSSLRVNKDIGILNANLNSFSEETCDKFLYSLGVTKPLKPKALERRFEEEEDIGSKITYRCARCAGCETCKAGNKTREVSIQEIMEEEIINKSIDIDLEKKTTFSRFPFRCDPIPILKKLWNSNSNERMALKVFEQQRRKAPEVRAATVKFHREVAEKGFVVPFKSLDAEIQEMIMSAEIRHYFLWRSVFKASLSTPCRVVVDPSQSGLNSVLCKGVNCLNSLYMIVINWRSWLVGFCGDISKFTDWQWKFRRKFSSLAYLLPGDTPFLLGINTSSQLPGREGVFLSQYDCFLAWKTICRIATLEVKEVLTKSQRANYEESEEGILYYGGRLSQLHEIKNTFYEKFQFVRPVALVTSQLTYAVVMHMHWLHNHPGVELLLQMVLQVIYVEKLRTLVKFIRKSCPRCRYLLKKTIKVEVSNQHQLAYSSAPPFYSAQIDVACGFLAHDVRQRVTKAAYILVIVCNLTSAVSLTVLEDLSTDQVVFGLERHAARHGWPVFLLPDKQSSFVKLEDLRISFRDLQGKLFQSQKIVLDFCTPNNHAEHGRVESRVKIVKSIFEKVAELGKKHSYIEWETVVQRTAASMNSLPIARSGDSRNPHDLEDFGLITPYHFLLGFNPNRILDTSVSVINSRCKMLEVVQNTQDYLHEVLLNHIHRFIPYHSHQFREKIPDPGDIVLFIHVDSSRARNRDWKFGRIVENYVDGNPGKVRILYRNANETTFRETTRNLKDVCLISTLDEISFNTEEHRLAMEHQKKYLYMK